MPVPGIVDWSGRMRRMMEFVGLTDDDVKLVRDSGPILAEHADELTEAIYRHFLEFPETRAFFLDEATGEVDLDRIERRRHSLTRWLRNSIEFRVDEDLPVFLLAIGIVHSHPAAHREHLGSIPMRFMIGTMSLAQTAVSRLLKEEVADQETAWRTAEAWNKLLMVQLDLLVAGYVTEQPIPPRQESPSASQV